MKQILLTIAILMSMTICAVAQNDYFFKNINDNIDRTDSDISGCGYPTLPSFGTNTNQDSEVPLGTGIFLLTALGAGYAISKRRKEER